MIKLDDYRHIAKPIIAQWCLDRPDVAPHDHVSMLAQYIPCPCIAVCHYMIELYGETPEIIRLLDILNNFYKEEISGIIEVRGYVYEVTKIDDTDGIETRQKTQDIRTEENE